MTTDHTKHISSPRSLSRPLPSIVTGPRCGVNRLRGELVGPQGGGEAGWGGSQGVGAIQRGGRGAVTGGGSLLRLVLQEDKQGSR